MADKDLTTIEERVLPSIPEALNKLIDEPTPKNVIKFRPGRGNQQIAYVPHWWFVKRLNEIFGKLWDFSILEQQVGNEQVWVKGQLKVWLTPTFCITKTAFGGTPIAKANGVIVDIGDSLKSASADSLKKAASLLGICADVYGAEADNVPTVAKTGTSIPDPF